MQDIKSTHPMFSFLNCQHSEGLILADRLSEGLKNGIKPERLKSYADWFWLKYILPNFEFEEHHIFPILGFDHDLVKKAMKQHRRLRKLFRSKEDLTRNLSLLEEELIKLIRFEEFVLFKKIISVSSEEQLTKLQLKFEDSMSDCWTDKFWELS